MASLHFMLAAGWVLYCVIHSVTASGAVKSFASRALGPYFKLYRLLYSALALLLLIPLVWLQLVMASPRLFEGGILSASIGLLMMTSGLLGMAGSLWKYVKASRGAHEMFVEGMKPELQVEGIHRKVRHPLYLFTFLFIWGIFLAAPLLSMLITNVNITGYTLVAIRFEEKKLAALYGADYEAYRKRTPMIIPHF